MHSVSTGEKLGQIQDRRFQVWNRERMWMFRRRKFEYGEHPSMQYVQNHERQFHVLSEENVAEVFTYTSLPRRMSWLMLIRGDSLEFTNKLGASVNEIAHRVRQSLIRGTHDVEKIFVADLLLWLARTAASSRYEFSQPI